MSDNTPHPRNPRAVLDVDGVLADLSTWTPILTDPDIPARSRWKTFFSHIHEAPLIEAGAELVAALVDLDVRIHYSTTRPGWLTTPTRRWITDQGLPSEYLYVRQRHDYRGAPEIKLDHCRQATEWTGHPVIAFVDDEPPMVTGLRAAGIPALTLADLAGATGDDLRRRLTTPPDRGDRSLAHFPGGNDGR